jgi:hypothetical protein
MQRNEAGIPVTRLAEAAVVDEPTGIVTIPNVELVASGSWLAAAGDGTLTEDDLDAMVAAAADPEVDAAPLRIGHTDARFDGEPSLGWVENVRREGTKLLGDLVGVPAKLAEVIPAAYRRRSVEMLGSADTPVTTASGKTYSRVLSGLALLGVQRPAVKGLADVLALYADANAAPGATTLLAEVSLDDVRRGAVEAVTGAGSYDTGPGGWAEELYTDHVIVSTYDEAGGKSRLYRVGYLVDNVTGAVTFGEPVEVRRAYVPLTAASAAPGDPAAGLAILDAVRTISTPLPGGDTPLAPRSSTFAHGAPSAPYRPVSTPATAPRTEETPMAQIDEARLRELLGIEADADIEATIAGLKATPQTPEAAAQSAAEAAGTGTPAAPAAAPAAPAATPELVTLSEGSHAELVTAAQQGAEALRILREQEATALVRTALGEGRIAPSEVELFTTRAKANLDDTRALLAGLAPRFPVTELGSGEAAGNPDADAAWDAYARSLGVDG